METDAQKTGENKDMKALKNPQTWGLLAEKQGFEPWRRSTQPTPLAGDIKSPVFGEKLTYGNQIVASRVWLLCVFIVPKHTNHQ